MSRRWSNWRARTTAQPTTWAPAPAIPSWRLSKRRNASATLTSKSCTRRGVLATPRRSGQIAAKPSASWAGKLSMVWRQSWRQPGAGIAHTRKVSRKNKHMENRLSHSENVWEERWHPLREEWVVIAAHRQNRGWSGATVAPRTEPVAEYVADCPFCPGNRRYDGGINPASGAFVFDNSHPCVGPDAPEELAIPPSPYQVRRADGLARVLCYSPKHNLTMAEMPHEMIAEIVQLWQQQSFDLGARPEVRHVLCFENKGEVVGVSMPHPHGQIY